jgi:16S rRNA (cytosine967-C5)-methyltransferase
MNPKQRGKLHSRGLKNLHKAAHDPRAAALAALYRIIHAGEDSQAALGELLSSEALSVAPSDKRLCTELVYGTLRHYPRLQNFAASFLSRPEKLPVEMRLLLLQTLYEMAFLRIPDHAGVNWAVSHVRHRFGKGLAAVANGSLRSMQRDITTLTAPERPTESSPENFALRWGAPEWLARLWWESYGQDACQALLRASASAAPSGLRLNRARQGWEEARRALLEAPDDGRAQHAPPLAVGSCGQAFFSSLPWQAREMTKKGLASRQSMAAYEMLERFAPRTWPGPVWDCCAGRGGKSLPLLEQGIAVALASDLSSARLRGLAEEYARLELSHPPCPPLLLADAAERELSFAAAPRLSAAPAFDPAALPETFDTILIDAPCSGLGTLARRPEIRLRRTPEDIARLAGLQARILENAWQRLNKGGRLIYLTCTVTPAENEGQIARFVSEHPDAALIQEERTPFDSPLSEFFYGARVDKAR